MKGPSVIRRVARRIKRSASRSLASCRSHSTQLESSPRRALDWVRQNSLNGCGIRVHSENHLPYPEVTGYLIPTLIECGDGALARQYAQWLVAVQRADGGYTGEDGLRYIFDTGQVLRGLLAVAEEFEPAREAAERATRYLQSQLSEGGNEGYPNRYGGDVPEAVHLYVLPPLVEAAKLFGNASLLEQVDCCLDYYMRDPETLRLSDLTHFLAYQLEALIDLGRSDVARLPLTELSASQDRSGAIWERSGGRWVCVPGLAQLAVCWYKIGMNEPADMAMNWLESHQSPAGGFRGSEGKGASYFSNVELSWAAKFYLDAHRLRLEAFFDKNALVFQDRVAQTDGRLEAIRDCVGPGMLVAEVGCGRGRFLSALKGSVDELECTGVDISRELLELVPQGIGKVQGTLERCPVSDNAFDVVFCVEAIEHSINPEAAIREMVRIARPGGWVIIVDKQQAHWGRLSCPSWERWPAARSVSRWLGNSCDNVSAETVAYDGKPSSDGLMMVWKGRKRSPLTGVQWHEVLLDHETVLDVANSLKSNQRSEWDIAMSLQTHAGDSLLEVGSGTGAMSIHLALGGRRVTLLDISADSLDFAKACAREVGVDITTVVADATATLPFPDKSFDCVWSSGLLEHYGKTEKIAMLKEWARLSSSTVISLVPNASCLAYRVGKMEQEAAGKWPYGLENPCRSLVEEFDAAGLAIASEYSVGWQHAFSYLSKDHALRRPLYDWLASLTPEQTDDCSQGVLLVTVGHVTHGNQSTP